MTNSSATRPGNPVPGSSRGMPEKIATPGRARPGQPDSPADASDEASLALPHERDQSVNSSDTPPDPQVRQASADLQRGLKDTGKGPTMDATYRKQQGR